MAKTIKSRKKLAVIMTVLVVVIVVLATFLYIHFTLEPRGAGPLNAPTYHLHVTKDDNNWSIGIVAIGQSKVVEEFDDITFTIDRGNATVVSFTINDKQPRDPTHIDPVTGNATADNVYALRKDSYTIYFYDNATTRQMGNKEYNGTGMLSLFDRFYIVDNRIQSGDYFQILWKELPCASFGKLS